MALQQDSLSERQHELEVINQQITELQRMVCLRNRQQSMPNTTYSVPVSKAQNTSAKPVAHVVGVEQTTQRQLSAGRWPWHPHESSPVCKSPISGEEFITTKILLCKNI